MRHILSIVLLLLCVSYSNSLTAQCENPKKRYLNLIDKGEYENWLKKWEYLQDKVVENTNYQIAFQCQATIVLDQLIKNAEASFTVKDQSRLKKFVATYADVLATVKDLYPIFFYNTQRDYLQYDEYMDYLASVNQYSGDFTNLQEASFDQQLYSALNKLLVQGDKAIKESNLILGQLAASDYTYLIDKLGVISKLLNEDFTKDLPSNYRDQYNHIKCIPAYISAKASFENGLYIQAFEQAQCESDSIQKLSRRMLQKFVIIYDSIISENELISRAQAIAEFDSIVKNIIDTLPCPSTYSQKTDCDFRDIIDTEYRQPTINSLISIANTKYEETKYDDSNYKVAISILKAVIAIHKDKSQKASLARTRNKWVKEGTIILEEKIDKLIERKEWLPAYLLVKDIAYFNDSFDSKRMNTIIDLHKFYTYAKDSLNVQKWQSALKNIELADSIFGTISCKPCTKITLLNITKTRDAIIGDWEKKIDFINQNTLNREEAERQIAMIAKIVNSYHYPAEEKKLRLRCINFHLLGKYHEKKRGGLKTAFEYYEKALASCQKRNQFCGECPLEDHLITDIKRVVKQKVNDILMKAETPYNNGYFVSACELAQEAKSWVKIYNKYKGENIYEEEKLESILNDACGKAHKTVRIVLKQSSVRKFSSQKLNSLQLTLENNLRTALSNTQYTYAQHIDVVSGRTADFTLSIDIENISYSLNFDYHPTVSNFCIYRQYWISPNQYTYVYEGLGQVKKYKDSATGKVRYRSNINRYFPSGKEIPKTWKEEAWRSDIAPGNLAYCNSCPIKFLNYGDRSYFKNNRQDPGVENLLFPPLKQELIKNIPIWVNQLDDLMRR